MRIGTKLSLISSIALAIVCLLSILIILTQKDVTQQIENTLHIHQKAIEAVTLKADLNQLQQSVLHYLVTGDDKSLQTIELSHAHIKKTLNDYKPMLITDVSDTDPNHPSLTIRHRFTRFYHTYNQRYAVWQELVQLRKDGHIHEAITRYQHNALPVTSELDSFVKQIMTKYIASYTQANKQLNQKLLGDVRLAYIIIAITLILYSIIIIGLHRSITQPIRRFHKAVKAITQGQFPPDISIQSNDEIGELADAFKEMTYKIQSSTTSLDQLHKEMTERKQAQANLAQYQNKLRNQASEMSLVEERERQRIAGGLHDNICQKLVLIKLNLLNMQRRLKNPDVDAPIQQQCELIDEMITDARALTFELGNPLLHNVGLDAALSSWLQHHIQDPLGLQCDFKSNSRGIRLKEAMRFFLYRAVCELVTNVVKHAEAKHVSVTLTRNESEIVIIVRDDGKGFDVPQTLAHQNDTECYGLFRVTERVEYLGGQCKIKSTPNHGTTVTLRIPYEAQTIIKETSFAVKPGSSTPNLNSSH